MDPVVRKPVLRYDRNQTTKAKKSLKVCLKRLEAFYHICSKDVQADLHLCWLHIEKQVLS